MKVVATAIGFYGGERRRPGAVFEVKDGTKARWFQPLEEAQKAKPKAAAKKADEPTTLSEIGKQLNPADRDVI